MYPFSGWGEGRRNKRYNSGLAWDFVTLKINNLTGIKSGYGYRYRFRYRSIYYYRESKHLDLRSAIDITSASAALPNPSGFSPAVGTCNDRSCGIPWNTGDLQVLILSLWIWQCMQTQHLEEIKSKLWTERSEICVHPCVIVGYSVGFPQPKNLCEKVVEFLLGNKPTTQLLLRQPLRECTALEGCP